METHKEKEPWCNQAYQNLQLLPKSLYQRPRTKESEEPEIKKENLIIKTL